LFLAPPPFGAPIDALARMRFVRSATAIADLAIMYRTSVWVVLRRAMAARAHQYGGSIQQPFSTEVMGDRMVEPPSGIYDHLVARPGLALQPARRYQLAVLAATLDETVVQARGVRRRPFLPFLSQPIVEMALRSRPEDLFTSDHNRLPVRRSAYHAAKLPNLWRTDKGDTTHSALRGILLHKNHIRETCLDGWCAREGMIDRKGMENVINRTALGFPAGLVEITRFFAVETFLQGILGLRTPAPVASQPMALVPESR
jgi:asparagine synthase (glutamine-hydrolysing)